MAATETTSQKSVAEALVALDMSSVEGLRDALKVLAQEKDPERLKEERKARREDVDKAYNELSAAHKEGKDYWIRIQEQNLQTAQASAETAQRTIENWEWLGECRQDLARLSIFIEFARSRKPGRPLAHAWDEYLQEHSRDRLWRKKDHIVSDISLISNKLGTLFDRLRVYGYNQGNTQVAQAAMAAFKHEVMYVFSWGFCRELALWKGEGLEEARKAGKRASLPAPAAPVSEEPAAPVSEEPAAPVSEDPIIRQCDVLRQRLGALPADLTPKAQDSEAWVKEWLKHYTPLMGVITETLRLIQEIGPHVGPMEKVLLRIGEGMARRANAKIDQHNAARGRDDMLEMRALAPRITHMKNGHPALVDGKTKENAAKLAHMAGEFLHMVSVLGDPKKIGVDISPMLAASVADISNLCRVVQRQQNSSDHPRSVALRELMTALAQRVDTHLSDAHLGTLTDHLLTLNGKRADAMTPRDPAHTMNAIRSRITAPEGSHAAQEGARRERPSGAELA